MIASEEIFVSDLPKILPTLPILYQKENLSLEEKINQSKFCRVGEGFFSKLKPTSTVLVAKII